jgi:hypothetical protein
MSLSAKRRGDIEAFTISKFRQALAEMALARRLVIELSRVSSFIPPSWALICGIRRTCSGVPTSRCARSRIGHEHLLILAEGVTRHLVKKH